MKAKEIMQLIQIHCPNAKAVKGVYDRIYIQLPDGGEISLGLDNPTRKCNFPFLYFNVRGSKIRVAGQDNYNGKLNYFEADAKEKLIELLKELNEAISR